MLVELIRRAFEKAEQEIDSDTVSRRAEHLADQIQELAKESYGVRSLRDKYNEIIGGEEEITIPPYVSDALSKYLGYESYADFIQKERGSGDPKEPGIANPRKWIYVAIVLAIALGLWVFYKNPFGTEMMVWNEDHYEVVIMDLDEHKVSELKRINKDRLENFRKVEPDCSYAFFDDDGLELIWYGKNRAGEYEFFTDLGRHPITGKTLKKITPYMIQKYICPTYPD